MPRQRPNYKPILLNLPVPMLEQVDVVADEQNVTRSQFLRQSVERNLNHYFKHERRHFQHLHRMGMT